MRENYVTFSNFWKIFKLVPNLVDYSTEYKSTEHKSLDQVKSLDLDEVLISTKFNRRPPVSDDLHNEHLISGIADTASFTSIYDSVYEEQFAKCRSEGREPYSKLPSRPYFHPYPHAPFRLNTIATEIGSELTKWY